MKPLAWICHSTSYTKQTEADQWAMKQVFQSKHFLPLLGNGVQQTY